MPTRSRTVAFLSAGCMQPGHPELREDAFEHELEFAPLHAACAERGVDLVTLVWDDPELDPERYDAFVIGTTWDYAASPDVFLDVLARIAAARPLLNPLPVVTWNLNKRYLADLEQRGAPVVPTLWRERADAATIEAAFEWGRELGADELVVKPEVGASAWRQARVARGAPLPPADELPPGRAMIQPFLPAAASEGELSFVFFDGDLSHCARKIPAAGDYRVQSMYGAREVVHEPDPHELELARRVLAAAVDRLGVPLFQARVDMLRGLDGELALMELELIEPYLYPEQGPRMGAAFADALLRRLG